MGSENGKQRDWEEWQLSALVLDELDDDVAAEIRAAAQRDPAAS